MPKVVLGMSGWTGFAPLSLAEEARLFKKHGVDVEIKFIPQKERHLTVAAGATQAVATTVDTYVAWTSAGIPLTQVLLLDKSKRSEEHTSELQSLMRISYAVFCLKKKNKHITHDVN